MGLIKRGVNSNRFAIAFISSNIKAQNCNEPGMIVLLGRRSYQTSGPVTFADMGISILGLIFGAVGFLVIFFDLTHILPRISSYDKRKLVNLATMFWALITNIVSFALILGRFYTVKNGLDGVHHFDERFGQDEPGSLEAPVRLAFLFSSIFFGVLVVAHLTLVFLQVALRTNKLSGNNTANIILRNHKISVFSFDVVIVLLLVIPG